MDEYVGGISVPLYDQRSPLLTRGIELLDMPEGRSRIARRRTEDLHQLQRAWETATPGPWPRNVSPSTTLFRKETRWPGYYYREIIRSWTTRIGIGFTLSRYDRNSSSRTREVGVGEGSGPSHHRLIARLPGTLTFPGSCVFRGVSCMSARPRHPVQSARRHPGRDRLISGRNRNVPTRTAARL